MERTSSDRGLIAARYAVGEAIGHGRSTVYRAEDVRLGRAVALKEVRLVSGDEDHDRVRLRARREAQAAARLNSPTVVELYDLVEEDGSIWLAMELVDAPSLSTLVKKDGALDHPRAARIGLDVLAALEAAHGVGVVHRDVKPANVLVGEDRAKLTDFGVATMRDATRVTALGAIIGSPAYMAPEQALGQDVGPATDLWALGATLYYAVEGKAPFDGGSALATASAVVNGEARPRQSDGPLGPVIDQLMRKDPATRLSAAAVREVLQRVVDGSEAEVDAESGAVATRALAGPPAPPPASPPHRPAVRHPSRRPPWPVLVAAAAVIVAAIALVVVWQRHDDSPGPRERAGQNPPPSSQPASGSSSTPTTRPSTTTSTVAVTTTTPAGGALPAGWVEYRNPQAGYRIGHPAGWNVRPAGGHIVDMIDPATGAYLRIDWTNTPRPDPVADWRQQASAFGPRHQGYQEIRIAKVPYRTYNAAAWEFRYLKGGRLVHALDLGFVAGNRGYALMFVTPEARWNVGQAQFSEFRRTFQP